MDLTASERQALERVGHYAGEGDEEGLAAAHDDVFGALGAAFVQGRMTGLEFEREFMEVWRLFRDHGVPTSEEVDRLFTDVDAFCADPELFEDGDLDEDGLRRAVADFIR